MTEEKWMVKQLNEYCRYRVLMVKDWKYKHCCSITLDTLPIRENPCRKDNCPIKELIEGMSDG